MGRAPCCDRTGLKKGPWTQEEDEKLVAYIKKHGQGNWRTLPKNADLERCGKSCRLRWTNYLRPDIKRGRFSFEEEETIIQLHSILGNNSACQMPGLVHANPAQQLHQDHMVASDYGQLPGYDNQLDYVPGLMQMASDTSNLQWSSPVTSSNNNNNCNVGSGVSTPSSSPAGRVNLASTTAFCANASNIDALIADADGLFDMHLSDLLDVSDYM
ncbi:unnamed protein product [Triticum turgidum subsp. durum]|uniref:Uncharacterized protein n=1 Tax=Triticum turgidum subsp. durum TaxID=4567 RepID=A0A9R1PLL7_TRITD|nr:unnamed protein product [Triticum turgidum subsp. durum]